MNASNPRRPPPAVGTSVGYEKNVGKRASFVRLLRGAQPVTRELLQQVAAVLAPDDRRRADESMRFLEEASRLFAASLDPERTLATVARLAVPRLADWAAVDLLEPDGTVKRVAVEHVDPKKIELAHAMQRRRPTSMESATGVARVIRTGEPSVTPRITDAMLVEALAADPEYLAMVREAGLFSLMILALPVHGHSRGAITFAFAESRRQFKPQDLAFAQALARRAGAAFENALAYRALEEANRVKDLFLGRAKNLQSIASELVTAASKIDVARVFARQRVALGAESCALYLLHDDGLRPLAIEGMAEERLPAFAHMPLGSPMAAMEACREGRPVWLESRDEVVARFRAGGADPASVLAVAAFPLTSGDHRLGALAFGFDTPRTFDDDEREYLVAIAHLWGQALQRVQLVETERQALRARIEDQVRSRKRADRLYRLTSALAATMTTARIAETFAEHAPKAVTSEAASVWLSDRGLEAGEAVRRVAAERSALFIEPGGAEKASAHLPLVGAAGELLGVASFDYQGPRSFAVEDRDLLLTVANQCGVALDRARAYEAEAIALRKKDEFLAMLGHELRNPLAPILTATRLIRLRGVATERELGILERHGRHLVRLVDDLLDVSRITSGKLLLQREPVDLREVADQAVEGVGKPFEDKELRLDLEASATPLWVVGDRERLVQVVTNLLVNASKFTPAGGSVRLTLERREGVADIVVEDDGEGIEPDLLPHIFSLFTQGRQSSDRRGGGLGLGLTIARRLVEGHGGHIEAKSAGRGHGTTVTVHLPVVEESARVEGAPERSTPPRASTQRRVLIVDDNTDAAFLLATFLGDLGYETVIAGDALEALAALGQGVPDVAILDIGLPGMDGYELAAELRSRLGARAPQLVAVTGYAQARDRERAMTEGFHAHFGKPVDIDKLAEVIDSLANAR